MSRNWQILSNNRTSRARIDQGRQSVILPLVDTRSYCIGNGHDCIGMAFGMRKGNRFSTSGETGHAMTG